jgi:hypothetical protein
MAKPIRLKDAQRMDSSYSLTSSRILPYRPPVTRSVKFSEKSSSKFKFGEIISVGNYRMVEQIGEGSFGTVYQVTRDSKTFAMKSINKKKL